MRAMVAQNPATGTLMMGGQDIYDKIIETLESNGDLEQEEVNRMVLFALVDLGNGRKDAQKCREGIDKLDKRLTKLEKFSFLMMAKNHPKAAVVITSIVVIFMIAVVTHLGLWVWIGQVIEEFLGVPLP